MKSRAERRWAVAKDVILFVVGLGGIIYQQVTGQVFPMLLIVFMTMTGVPALVNLVSLFKGLPTNSGRQESHSRGSSTRSK